MYELLFHPEAESEIYDLEPIMQAKVLKGLEKLEAKGPELRYPDTGIIQDGLFELRGNDSNLLIVFYVQIMPDDFVMQLHRF